MANKIYNSETRKYNNIPKLDSVGAYVLYENGSKEYFLDVALTDGLVTTATIGSLARTSHATGRGKIFSSDGSAWQEIATQTGVGGGASIGGVVTGGTQGSVPFIGAAGALNQDNTSLFYDDVNNTLKLGDRTYSYASGYQYPSYLQIANVTAYPVASGQGFYGAKFDIYTAPSAGATQTSAMRVRVNTAATGGTPTVTAIEAFANNYDSTVTTSIMQGLEGIVQTYQNATTSAAGWFQANTNSGGSGTTVTNLIGIRTSIGSFNQWTVTNASLIHGVAGASNGPTTNLYGLRFDGWTGSAVTNSYGIYMDTTIDRGSTSRYALYSLSTSPSLFSGTVALANGVAVASAGTINITGNVFHVTGTTNITSISGTNVNAGTEVILIFDASVTVTNGSNLRLAGDFSATANDTMKLVYDGTNWYEVSRSVNA